MRRGAIAPGFHHVVLPSDYHSLISDALYTLFTVVSLRSFTVVNSSSTAYYKCIVEADVRVTSPIIILRRRSRLLGWLASPLGLVGVCLFGS